MKRVWSVSYFRGTVGKVYESKFKDINIFIDIYFQDIYISKLMHFAKGL